MAKNEEKPLHRTVRLLYTGNSKRAVLFRYGIIAFDVVSILYFIVIASLPATTTTTVINLGLGVVILADFLARLWIVSNRAAYFRRVYVLADLLVIAVLFAGPLFEQNLAVLRVLRGLRLLHSYHLLRDLRRDAPFFRRHEDAVLAAVNLFVFVFVTTSVVFVLEFGEASGPAGYIDALYFTVATLTTTGFGDITLQDPVGKLLSVFIMIFGVALFLRLAKEIFQPSKVKHRCSDCGLTRHERDAIHCKHCGRELAIETEGLDD